MDLGIVTTIRPCSGTFVGVASFDATTTGKVAITFLPAHRALGTCLALLGHS